MVGSSRVVVMKTKLLASFVAAALCVLSAVAIGQMAGDAAAEDNLPAPNASGARKPAELPAGAIARLGSRRGQTLGDSVAAINAVAFSADGKTLATTDGYNGAITFWDLDSGKKLSHFTMREPDGYTSGPHLYSLSLSPSAAHIAWGGNQGVPVAGMSEVKSGKELWRHPRGYNVAFTRDGKYVISGAHMGGPKVLDAKTGEVVHVLAEENYLIHRLAVSNDTTTVAVVAERDSRGLAAYDSERGKLRIQIWDVASGRLRQRFDAPRESHGYAACQGITLSPDGKQVAYPGGRKIFVTDADTGKDVYCIDPANPPRYWGWGCVQFSPDGKYLLAFGSGYYSDRGGHLTSIHLFDAKSGNEVRRFDGGSQFGQGVFTPDGKRMVSFGGSVLQVWDVATGRVLPAYDGHRVAPRALAMDATGKTLASADERYAVCIWDVQRRALKRRLDLGPVQSVHLSADGKSLLLMRSSFEAMVIDLPAGAPRCLLTQTHIASQTPDGKWAACARFEGAIPGIGGDIHIIDVATGKERQRCLGHKGNIHALSFSRDGSRLISASHGRPVGNFAQPGIALVAAVDDTVRLWDVQRGKQIHQWNLDVETAALSPDGRMMVAGTADGRLRRFDADSGRELDPLGGHQAKVRAIAFSHDGKRLMSSDDAGGILLFNANTGMQLERFEPEQGGLTAAALSGDGRRLTTARRDTTILVWDSSVAK